MSLTNGIIVATNGMLSTIDDKIADAHRMAYTVTRRSPPVNAHNRVIEFPPNSGR